MDNYLLLGHILVCKVIPKDEVHPELWVGANRKWRKVPNDRVQRMVHNRVRVLDVVMCRVVLIYAWTISGSNRGRRATSHCAFTEETRTEATTNLRRRD